MGGIRPLHAPRAVEGVVVNASQLIAGQDPQRIMQELIAYRGVTAAALEAMQAAGFTKAVAEGLAAAARKSAARAKD